MIHPKKLNVVLVGLDSSACKHGLPLAERLVSYGEFTEHLYVVVPCGGYTNKRVELSKATTVYGVPIKGGKARIALSLFNRARSLIKELSEDVRGNTVLSTRDSHFLGLAVYILSRIYKLGFELQIHGFERETFLRRHIQSFLITRSSSVRVVSEWLKKKIEQKTSIDPDHITVAPVFTNWRNLYERTKDRRDEGHSRALFLTIGRLVPVKDIARQIEALKEVRREVPQAQLVIVGDGPERANLENVAQSMGVSGAVSFEGFRKDVLPYYERAGCFLLTSRSEGWGLVLVEALSAGLPIVTTRVGVADSYFKNNPNVFFVDKDGVESVASAMKTVLSNKFSHSAIHEDAYKTLLSLPTYEETITRYVDSWQKAHHNNTR